MDFSILYSLVSIIAPLLIFIAACYYISKKRSTDAILLFLGASIALVLNIIYEIIMPYLVRVNSLAVTEVTKYYTVLGIIGFIGGLLFAAGLFLLIYNTVNANKFIANQFPPNEFK